MVVIPVASAGPAARSRSVRAFSLSELTSEPWRNGGGNTRTVASGDTGSENLSGDDDWTWRVSIADINADGPFSLFPDVQRQLTLLAGEGLVLVGEQRTWRASQTGDVLAFPGAARVRAHLLGGPVQVWNLMLRGDAWRGQVRMWRYNGDEWMQPFTAGDARAVFVYVLSGELALRGSHQMDGIADITLAAGQGLWLSHPPLGLRMLLLSAPTLALTTEISAPYSHHQPATSPP